MGDDGLAAFLRARLDEDEAAANGLLFACRAPGPLRFVPGYGGPAADAFIARHDPARVLREVEADRRLLALYAEVARMDTPDPEPEFAWGRAAGLGEAVRLRAARFGDHPDYRAEWQP